MSYMTAEQREIIRITEENLDEKIKALEKALKVLDEKRKKIKLISGVIVAALNDSGHKELAFVIMEMIDNG